MGGRNLWVVFVKQTLSPFFFVPHFADGASRCNHVTRKKGCQKEVLVLWPAQALRPRHSSLLRGFFVQLLCVIKHRVILHLKQVSLPLG